MTGVLKHCLPTKVVLVPHPLVPPHPLLVVNLGFLSPLLPSHRSVVSMGLYGYHTLNSAVFVTMLCCV
jgi:hypothetical protein